ncbi:MAG TPA: hypothetical protein VKO18_09435 [Terriglobia bacterium]|nr:hypothetical protein [Terriglobia bacterium]
MDRRMGVVYGAFTVGALFLGLGLFIARSASGGPCESKAACYVTPGGSGATNGADWNNAYAGLPASLTCGVTYYLAGGTYDYTSASTTISNACGAGSPLVIYKAVSGGPGNPQNVAGWQSSYGTSQALLSQMTDADPEKNHDPFFTLSGTYITIDGVVPTFGTPTKKATFGIHLRSSNKVAHGLLYVTGANNTVKHVDVDGVANAYGFQVTACNRNASGVVTVTTNGNPPWVNGDNVDLYLMGGTPDDFSCEPGRNPSACRNAITISGNTIQYAQPGNNKVETCNMPAAPNPATVVLNGAGSAGVMVNVSANPSNLSFTDNYVHDVIIGMKHAGLGGCNHCTYLRNYIARNHGTRTTHVSAIDGGILNNSVIGQSVFEDIEGTGIATPVCGYTTSVVSTSGVNVTWVSGPEFSTSWAPGIRMKINSSAYTVSAINSGTSITLTTSAGTQTNVRAQVGCDWAQDVIYSNLAFCTIASQGHPLSSWEAPQCETSAIFGDDNGGNQVDNLLIYGNTIVRPLGCNIWVLNPSSTATATNNFVFCPSASVKIKGYGIRSSHNTGWGADISRTSMGGDQDFWTTHFPDPFVGSSDAAEDFRLASENVDAGRATGCKPGKTCLKDGTTLPSPYNIDLLGTPRGTDGAWARGAYELKGSEEHK